MIIAILARTAALVGVRSAPFDEGEDGSEGGEAGGHAAEVDFRAGPEGDGGEGPGEVG